MYCGKCGTQMTQNSGGCPNCGWRLASPKKSDMSEKIIVGVIILVMFVGGFFGIAGIIHQLSVVNPNNKLIAEAKETAVNFGPISYNDLTYGELLDNYCDDVKWSVLGARGFWDKGDTITVSTKKTVEFRGNSPVGDVFIQLPRSSNGKFSIGYVEINGHTANSWELAQFLTGALSKSY